MINTTKLRKWNLINKTDISPSKYFPLEKRSYQTPKGNVVDDFYIGTLADAVHVIPITTDGKIVMIRMYKQGVDDIIIQFPAGRFENKHKDLMDVAIKELEEETGIKIERKQLIFVGKVAMGSTKYTEFEHFFTVNDVLFNSKQNLDANEEIEILILSPKDIDRLIIEGKIYCALTISGWYLFKSKFPELVK
jgi:ADP-ribose pyrophosphatase